MEKIIPLVTTPLALASLAFLVLAVVLQKTTARRDVVNKVFWLLLILAVMGNIGYLIGQFVTVDSILRGDVRTDGGEPIGQAVIDVQGIGRTATSDDGNFELSIPYSRASKSYTLIVRNFGYKNTSLAVPGPTPAFQVIKLSELRFSGDDLIELHTGLAVTQNIGDPAIVINFRIKKQFNSDVRFTFTQVDIAPPSGAAINLNPSFIQINGQPAPTYLGGINLRDSLANAEATMMFERSQFARIAIANQLAQTNGPYWWQKQCSQKDGLDNDIATMLRGYFTGAFSWQPGHYKATIQYRINNYPGTYYADFDISPQDSARLKNVGDKLQRCAGVAFDMPQIANISYVDANAANYITKNASIPSSQ